MGRWKPIADGKSSNILAAVSSDGYLSYWHATSGKCIITIKDPNAADLYCLDFSKDGSYLAVGGKDFEVKLYDENTKTLVSSLKYEGTSRLGHSNRVFSVRFTDTPNLLVSGGWDNSVFLWDVREAKNVGLIYGPHICGDAIDTCGDVMVTGSYSNKQVLNLWDLRERKLISNIPWEDKASGELEYGYLYTALFDKCGKKRNYIAAGGAGRNEMRMFASEDKHELVAKIAFNQTITSIDFARSKKMFAAACVDGYAYLFSYEDEKDK